LRCSRKTSADKDEKEMCMDEPKFHSYTTALEQLFRAGDLKADDKLEEGANVRLIQNLIMAIGRDDLAAVGEMLADDVRLEILGADDPPFIRQAFGQQEMLEAVKQNFAAVQEQVPTIEAVIAQGDTVVIMLNEEGVVRATGKPYSIKGMQRFVIRQEKVELVQELFVQA
jgi:ketosteroid isomerase-like protein